METTWITEERRLWDKMMGYSPVTEESKEGRRRIAAAKAKKRPKPKLITEAQAVTRSWQLYRDWLSH